MIMKNQGNIVDTLASAEGFATDFTAIGAVICVTLSMNFKIFLQVSGVRTFGTFEDLGFIAMHSLIVLIQSRLSVRFKDECRNWQVLELEVIHFDRNITKRSLSVVANSHKSHLNGRSKV